MGAVQKLRMGAIGGISGRKLAPGAGVVVLGRSAPYLLLVYYVDTLVSLSAVFLLLLTYLKELGVDVRDAAQLPKVGTAVLLMTLVIGAVFGFPVLLVSMITQAAFDDVNLRWGLLGQLLFGCVSFLTMSA